QLREALSITMPKSGESRRIVCRSASSYIGCSKLYRQRDETANYIDLSYNQDFDGKSNLYFAEENFSIEDGWTERALRSALDGVMQLLHYKDAKFKINKFDFKED
ncbi:MAG: hypothetical protein MK132_20730, partial [Lentisphaerales bacterium]|nr:hypothetical protein [Lentisphaerales bacterium]